MKVEEMGEEGMKGGGGSKRKEETETRNKGKRKGGKERKKKGYDWGERGRKDRSGTLMLYVC